MGNIETTPGTKPDVSLMETEVPEKEGSDLSGESLFEGNLSEAKEDMSNILKNEAEIIEGFLTIMSTRASESVKQTPQGKEESTNQRSSPKWDGTPTPSVLAVNMSLVLEDDEVPLNLLFSTKSRTSSKSSSKLKKGTKRGPASHVEDELPSSQLVELDVEDTSQTIEETPEVGKESRRSIKAKSKGTKVAVMAEPSEGPGGTVKKSKGKSVVEESSKGERTMSKKSGVSVDYATCSEGGRPGSVELLKELVGNLVQF
ncbi:hypothetical protein HAX54_021201 [Datura stramonium]|uniref:Uncharacterized protein n=1 Tax=Datura stramonium TaxID=4076 RepID=A0ABS8S3X5_DATST|nr:hypothetical protein [Datura stramonium]